MDILNLFWNLDASDATKVFIFIVCALCALCTICKSKNENKPTKCEIDYSLCIENNNDMCYKCLPNGDFPSQIYNSNIGWINIDPKTGKHLSNHIFT